MKTCKNLLSLFVVALLLAMGTTGCQDYDIPAADTSLSYPAGEMALGAGSYTSAAPTVRAATASPQFAVTGVTHDGAATDTAIAAINSATGVITLTPGSNIAAIGRYRVSVRLIDGDDATDYPDALTIVVKGVVFDQAEVAATRGEALTIPVREAYLVQQEGTIYSLATPAGNADYNAFSVDKQTCAVTVSAQAEAGVYPLSIRVTNRTNPDGVVFADVLTVTVESKPYDLTYTPSSIILIPLEGHISPRPALRAASLKEGTAVSYALLDDFGGVFSIDAATGVITLAEDTPLVTQTPKTYALQVRATNAKGTTSFPEAYTVTVDPDKKADPVTGVSYPDTFPVKLRPGEAWTSQRPSVTGSTVGIAWSLGEGTPEGVTIDPKTGVITLAEGHRMPFKTEDNSLTVHVTNQGMSTPCTVEVGDFAIDPMLWQVTYVANSKENSTVNSGIGNMDRYSFSGYIQHNQASPATAASTIQVKNGFGKASNATVNGIIGIDVIGVNTANTWSDNTNMNNDYLVSSEIDVPAGSFNPAICFEFVHQYGTDAQNILELYIIEINSANVYTKGEQNQDDKGLDAMPSDLKWTAIATTDVNNAEIAAKIDYNLVSGSGKNLQNYPTASRRFDISAYKGRKVRFALRYWNPSANNNNSRTYRIESLRVEDRLAE